MPKGFVLRGNSRSERVRCEFQEDTPVATWRMGLPSIRACGLPHTFGSGRAGGAGCRASSEGPHVALGEVGTFGACNCLPCCNLTSQCDFQVVLQERIPSVPQRGFWGQAGEPPTEGEVGAREIPPDIWGPHVPTWGSLRSRLRKAVQKEGEALSSGSVSFEAPFSHGFT